MSQFDHLPPGCYCNCSDCPHTGDPKKGCICERCTDICTKGNDLLPTAGFDCHCSLTATPTHRRVDDHHITEVKP